METTDPDALTTPRQELAFHRQRTVPSTPFFITVDVNGSRFNAEVLNFSDSGLAIRVSDVDLTLGNTSLSPEQLVVRGGLEVKRVAV